MKKIFLLNSLIAIIFITACSSGDSHEIDHADDFRRGNNTPASDYFDYNITIASPNNLDKSIGDAMSINIDFKSSTGKTVHYIEISIISKLDGKVIYNKPSNMHIDDDSGMYNFNDTFTLSVDNGISVDTNWILEAKVWGTNADEEDVIKSIEFHINS
jgi:hypothetical protein